MGEAADAARHAVAAQPDYALAWSNLGAILLDLGDETGATDAFRRSLALRPDARTLRALAALARQRGHVDEAIELYERIDAATPGDTGILLSLAGTLAERDDLDAARDVYARARSREPQLLRAVFGARLTLPMVYADAAAVAAERARYADGLAALEAELPALVAGRAFADVVDDLRWTTCSRTRGGRSRSCRRASPRSWRAPVDAVGSGMADTPAAVDHRQAVAHRFRVVVLSMTVPAAGTSVAGWPGSIARASRSSSITCGATRRRS